MFVPIKDKQTKGTRAHKFVRTTFVHTVKVDKRNLNAIAKALGIPAKKLKPGKLHIGHEGTKKKKGRS